MFRLYFSLLVTTWFVFGMDAEELISRHIQAKGGLDPWNHVQSMKVTGQYQAFSVESPFVLQRVSAGNKYYFHTFMNKKKVTIGFDGQELWWENHWFGKSAMAVTGLDQQVIMRDVMDFPTPFFKYKEKGYEVTFLGENDFDGLNTLAIKLKRKEGEEETWYFDPETFLEVGCDSPGSDFGMAYPSRTFFDEFKTVHGLVIPFFIETQFAARNRVMMVDEVLLNVDVPEFLFKKPLPMGMEEIKNLVGHFQVISQQRNSPRAPFKEVQYVSDIVMRLSWAMLEEQFKGPEGQDLLRVFTFDTGIEAYRVTRIDSETNHMLVMQGMQGADGRLVVDSLAGHTSFKTEDFEAHFRLTLFDIQETGFQLLNEVSFDGGTKWFEMEKAQYSKK